MKYACGRPPINTSPDEIGTTGEPVVGLRLLTGDGAGFGTAAGVRVGAAVREYTIDTVEIWATAPLIAAIDALSRVPLDAKTRFNVERNDVLPLGDSTRAVTAVAAAVASSYPIAWVAMENL